MSRRLSFLAATVMLAAGASTGLVHAQQEPDTRFDTRVARPAFTSRHPKLAIDEAHHNFHTMTGRYLPFANLMRGDGCEVVAGKEPFTAKSLAGLDLLVISNALGDDDMGSPAALQPAFTPEECAAVRAWVEAGGGLLLIADHSPMGSAARGLGEVLGVDMRSSYAIDVVRGDSKSPSTITYTAGAGLDTAHAIVRGRDRAESVRKVITFTGQSLTGPAGSTALLQLSDRAEDLMVGLGEANGRVPKEKRLSAAGRAQGLAFELGRGRVVVLAEAAMMSAQVAGWRKSPMGMNVPGTDDRQFALNVVRWLARAL